MYIAMNRFRVMPETAEEFERMWRERDSYLNEMPGFVEFRLLKGPVREDHILYSSHTVWRSKADFEAWTKSDAFRAAHARAGQGKPLTIGRPEFEGFESVLLLTADRLSA